MKRLATSLVIVFVLAGGLFAWRGIATEAPAARSYYVDYERGTDSNNGLSASTAWKHAPGDPAASGRPAAITLKPGDRILFAPGVRYRGAIQLKFSGADGAPITYMSASEGNRAIIDGSDPPLSVRPCRSAADCAQSPQWHTLTRVEFAEPLPERPALFTPVMALHPAQEPNPSDPFYTDRVSEYLEADGKQLEMGKAQLPHALVEKLAAPGNAALALWVRPNLVAIRPVLSLAGDVASFDNTDLKHYTDRPSRVALVGHPSLIDQPGEFALLEGNRVVLAMLPAGTKSLSVARGRGGINLNGQSHIIIRNLDFENMSDAGTGVRAGVAIQNYVPTASDIEIGGNRFTRFAMPNGQGPITLRNVENVKIARNIIDGVSSGSGIRISQPSKDVEVADNRISKIGRTAIMMMGVENGLIAGNQVSDVAGVHGNGISTYLGNHNVRVIYNTVWDTSRPMTFHGDRGQSGKPTNLVFARNVLIASDKTAAAISSWGKGVVSVRIEGNVMVGGKAGALLVPSDKDLVLRHNLLSGLLLAKGEPAGWQIEDNVFTRLTWQQQRAGDISVSPSLEKLAARLIDGGQAPPKICEILGSAGSNAADRRIGATAHC